MSYFVPAPSFDVVGLAIDDSRRKKIEQLAEMATGRLFGGGVETDSLLLDAGNPVIQKLCLIFANDCADAICVVVYGHSVPVSMRER